MPDRKRVRRAKNRARFSKRIGLSADRAGADTDKYNFICWVNGNTGKKERRKTNGKTGTGNAFREQAEQVP